ncbi:F-box protein SKIP23-like protein [Cinnamomum micranthum f. kanehirae]|uniref:F-box protein SKIP23-like protein n=1 Tax=Cinnamomum micranthum f. kanehirae TaxID=337451 RepID=A0A443PFB0_9MAGN|nr:F-box protein SKIP23-like protein [Cinnamomum micranthum f. kanehirae]
MPDRNSDADMERSPQTYSLSFLPTDNASLAFVSSAELQVSLPHWFPLSPSAISGALSLPSSLPAEPHTAVYYSATPLDLFGTICTVVIYLAQFQLISMGKRLEDLDEDILDCISNHCSLRDCIRMGAVCKSWLSVSWERRQPRQLPWLMMPSADCFFSLSVDTILDAIKFPELHNKRCCGSFNNADARGWLMTIDNMSLEMGLFHPWRKIQLQLPHHSSLPRRYPHADDDPDLAVVKIRAAAMSDDAKVLVVIYDLNSLAFCRIGEKGWTQVSPTIVFHDAIYHKGQFYAVTIEGSVGILRINTSPPYLKFITERVMNVENLRTYYPRTYLVADSASERLLVFRRLSPPLEEVLRHPSNYNSRITLGFKVYELLLKKTGVYKKNLVQVESLIDRLIFLGQNSSMLLMESQFPGSKGNCIYFTDDFMEVSHFKSPLGCVDLGVFNMEDNTVQPLLMNRFHPTFSPPIWIMPPL